MQTTPGLANQEASAEVYTAVQDWAGANTCLPVAQKANVNLFI